MSGFDGSGDAAHAAALLAVDPAGLGGVLLQAAAGPAREAWTAYLRSLLGEQRPLKRMPLQIADERLLGGLDLAATLHAGRPVAQRGLLAACDGGVLLLPMAERISAGTAARLTLALDQHEVAVEREGLTLRSPARFGAVAFDESVSDDEAVPAPLCDRLALHLRLTELRPGAASAPAWTPDDVESARARLAQVAVPDEVLQALCAAAQALGVFSMRAPLLALRVARASAALAGRDVADEDDARLAARLVLGPRATTLPPSGEPEPDAEAEPEPPPPPEPPEPTENEADDASNTLSDQPLDDRVLDAARASIPSGLLLALVAGHAARVRAMSGGRAGALRASARRGRPVGVRRGDPAAGARLNLLATLRAAAPWQRLRRLERPGLAGNAGGNAGGVQVRRSDFHITRYQQRSETTTLFAVDASGSAALHRLAEAKGAVELLLADCYVRRDRVALVAFRGKGAELLLPPTRSLVRAKRSLAGLPGGGGTPLAAGIEAATALVEQVQRRGDTAVVVLLTDGRANVARDGLPGREHAQQDALAAARAWRLTGATALLLDTSPQPAPQARAIAEAMGATYLPLPHADAAMLSQAVRLAAS